MGKVNREDFETIDSGVILQELAERAGISMDELRANIEKLRERVSEDDADHLGFDEWINPDEILPERRIHLASCELCKKLVEIGNG